MTVPAGNSSLRQINVVEPPTLGPNNLAFDEGGDMCRGSAVAPSGGIDHFNRASCPPQSKIGKMTISTPLLPREITGTVYLINKLPPPWLRVNVDNSAPGVKLDLIGNTSLPLVDPTCDETETFCQSTL